MQDFARIGRLLRRLSISEFPRLINIPCGEIGAIGPADIRLNLSDNYQNPAFTKAVFVPMLSIPMHTRPQPDLIAQIAVAIEDAVGYYVKSEIWPVVSGSTR